MKAVKDLLAKNSSLSKEIESFQKDKAKSVKGDLKKNISEQNGVNVLAEIVELDGASIQDILFQLKGEVDNFVGILGGVADGKCSLSIIATDNIVKEKDFHAGNIIREVSSHIKGGGGGQPFFAKAGGKNPDGLQQAIDAVLEKI